MLSGNKMGGMRIEDSILMLLQRYISVWQGVDPSDRHFPRLPIFRW